MIEYFQHDYHARNDPKIQKILLKLGHEGKSVFWDLVEMMYENNGKLIMADCESYAFALRTNYELIANLIENFNVFKISECGTFFYSDSINKRLELRVEKSNKARESVKKRWDKSQQNNDVDTNVLRSAYDSNTIKENKRKVKDKEKNNTFIQSTILAENEFSTRKIEKEISDEGKFFAAEFQKTLPPSQSVKDADLKNWAETFDKLIRIDKRAKDEIYAVVRFARNDSFWKSNFMSANKLRMKDRSGVLYYDVFLTKMKSGNNDKSNPKKGTADELAEINAQWQMLRNGQVVGNNNSE